MLDLLKALFRRKGRLAAPTPEQVREALEQLPELSAKLEYLLHNRQFRVDQKKPEFLRLLNLIEGRDVREVLEIGGRRGGSSLMFSLAAGPQARVLTMDLNNSGSRLANLNRLCVGRQVQFWQGDSHAQASFDRVSSYLQGRPLDLLFIDGDHTYEGAKQDFVLYSKLVADGALIALHDIQLDYQTRFGVRTAAWTGGVPQLWQEIQQAGFDTEDLISDPFQDGYGIGVVRWNAATGPGLMAKLSA